MNVSSAGGAKPRSLSPGRIFRLTAVLLLVTLVAVRFSSGLLAKYAQKYVYLDQARVAKTAQAAVREHEAVLSGGQYTLDMTSVVSGNTYTAVLPGTDIPKDPFVAIDGNNETACSLYVEIYTDVPAEVTYTVGTGFLPTAELAPQHGGTMYKYNQPILPNTPQNVQYIIRNNKIMVSDTFKDKSDPTKNVASFTFEVYAYLVQID